ncbi:GtrA family protein [Patescibacteria group bacterium]|nr:GtrA family protein [Patescibacteria group bacterium]
MAHFLKFLIVGTIGFIINTTVLILGVRVDVAPSIAGPAGAELAIISNFILNNFFTFSDRSLAMSDVPMKFVQFNILSFGSVIIQFVFLKTGELIFGLKKFKQPILLMTPWSKLGIVKLVSGLPVAGKFAKKFSAYLVFYVAGVGVGLIVNFIIYSQIIWK